MLWLLADTQSRHGWSIRAAHVDHGIQSAQTRRRFRWAVEQISARLAVPLDLLDVDAVSEAERSGDGIEAAARRLRYDALAQLAAERGAPIVSVAHTRDDQAETVLLHILRGSGLDGLSGMPISRPLTDHVELVRPMLGLGRKDSEAICRAVDWQAVHDPSNDSPQHTRNRVRSELLPLMRQFNPKIVDSLAQMAEVVGADRALLEAMAQDSMQASLTDRRDALDRRAILALSDALAARALRAFCRERGVELSAERTSAAMAAIRSGHGRVELPGGAHLSVAGGTVALEQIYPQAERCC